MARSQVFQCDTTLYHPVEGARVFPQGETDPGNAWSDNPGGDRSETSMPSVMKDLIEANDRADALGVRLDAQAHDMANTAAEATAAKEKLAEAEQRAIAAEAVQATAEAAAKGYMDERDAARAELQVAATKQADAEAEAAKVPGLVAALDTANQTIADLNDKLASGPVTDATDAPAKRTRGPNKPKPDAATPDAQPEA